MSVGIDYSGINGTCNRDSKTGIRYGIISAHRLAHWSYDEFEGVYWRGCGHCGNEHTDDNKDESHGWIEFGNCQIACLGCGEVFSDDAHYGDEATCCEYDKGGLQMRLDNAGDVWVFLSPLTIKAGFCSPCAPGACHLESPTEEGAECYAVPRDWFDDESPCPYPEVKPEADTARVKMIADAKALHRIGEISDAEYENRVQCRTLVEWCADSGMVAEPIKSERDYAPFSWRVNSTDPELWHLSDYFVSSQCSQGVILTIRESEGRESE